jgi:hypothetical protein
MTIAANSIKLFQTAFADNDYCDVVYEKKVGRKVIAKKRILSTGL